MGVLIAYSSSAHRNLDLLSTREVPGRTGVSARLAFLLCCLLSNCLSARRTDATPLRRAARGRVAPEGTPGGAPPGRDRPGRGVRTHPGRAAYREDREHTVPVPPRSAADRPWPLAACTPHRCAQGMRGHASGQTPLSLPPRTDLTPPGEKSNSCLLQADVISATHGRDLFPGTLPGLLRVRTDVDPPAGEPGREPGVLSFLADRQRQLVVRHGHPGGAGGHVDDLHLAHPSG